MRAQQTKPGPRAPMMDVLPLRMEHSVLTPARPRSRIASLASSTSSGASDGIKTIPPFSRGTGSILAELRSCFDEMDRLWLSRSGSPSAALAG